MSSVSLKQRCLNIPAKQCSEVFALADGGRAFQASARSHHREGAITQSAELRIGGTISVDVEADWRRR